MYTPPKEFTKKLNREFNNRLRVRWSSRKGEWHLEQKIRRGLLDYPYNADGNDDHIRIRDGYIQIMAIRPGDRMPCPRCGLKLSVPKFEFAEVKCDYCYFKNNGEYKVTCGYFELNDILIDYLKRLDPDRDFGKQRHKEADEHNRKNEEADWRAQANNAWAYGADNFNRVVGIQQVGFTGREKMWDHK